MTRQTTESYAQVAVAKDLDEKELEDIANGLKCPSGEDKLDAILWSLANLQPGCFNNQYADTLKRVLCYDKEFTGRLFHYKPKGLRSKPALHHAIKNKSFAFLDWLLYIDDAKNDFPPDKLRFVRAEIVAALREKDDVSNSPSCLYSAVDEKLACVPQMVKLCALVQNDEMDLLLDAMDREATRQGGEKVDRNHPPESIFTMTDGDGNTVLHLLMDSLGKTYLTAPVRIGPRSLNGQPVFAAKSMEYDPMAIIEEIERVCKQGMGELWRAVNNAGMSPYKSLLDNPGHSDEQRIGFQEKIKAKILSSLSDISHLKRALYGTRGMNPSCYDSSNGGRLTTSFDK